MRDDAGRSSVSPDGRLIAFVSGRKEAEIWMMGADGEGPRRLAQASTGARFLQLQWSPDGRSVAYMKSSSAGQDVSIETIDLQSGATNRIFSSPGLQSFCWTGDGKLFLALEEPSSGQHDTNLWQSRMHPNGEMASAPTQLTRWAGFSFWDLSATSDGRQLAFVKSGSQADVYLGKLGAAQLTEVRRLTLNEHDDLPGTWTPKGEVLFFSDRNGKFDIFRQNPDSEQAEQLLSNSQDKLAPELSPDGKWLLYWQLDRRNNQPTKSLMKMDIAGGSTAPLLQAQSSATFHCARAKQFCLLAEADTARKQAVFSQFEIASPQKIELARTPWSGTGEMVWALSEDGSAIALAEMQETATAFRVIGLPHGTIRNYDLKDITVTGIAGLRAGWLFTSSSLRGNEILGLNSKGQVRQLWSSGSPVSNPVVSADGRLLAFGLVSQDSNAWLLEQK